VTGTELLYHQGILFLNSYFPNLRKSYLVTSNIRKLFVFNFNREWGLRNLWRPVFSQEKTGKTPGNAPCQHKSKHVNKFETPYISRNEFITHTHTHTHTQTVELYTCSDTGLGREKKKLVLFRKFPFRIFWGISSSVVFITPISSSSNMYAYRLERCLRICIFSW
jgi:hypothetical protein